MKFGIRTPSLKRRIAARTSWKRVVRHSMGLKAPRGMGILTSPKKAIYNKIYNKTSVSIDRLPQIISKQKKVKPTFDGKRMTITQKEDGSIDCPRCNTSMGQPIKVGWIMKRLVFRCPKCELEAKVR